MVNNRSEKEMTTTSKVSNSKLSEKATSLYHWIVSLNYRNFSVISLLLFAILAFLLYGQTITYNYTYMDDHAIVQRQMKNLSKIDAIPKAFTEDVFHKTARVFYYRPMLTISLAIDAMVGGGKLPWFHIINILLHVLVTWTLLLFLIEMDYERMKSFLFSLIFLVHPVVTQAVAWIPGRNDSLLALFLFPSFLFLIRYLKSQKIIHYILHFAFYILALFTKETAIAIPMIATLYLLVIHKKYNRNLIFLVGGWILLSVSWLWIRHLVQGGLNEFSFTDSISSIFHNLGALVPYIGKSIFPIGLSVFPFMKDMNVAIIAGIIAFIILAILLLITRKKRWGYLLFAISWFLLFLIPSFIRGTEQEPDFMEHRVYISMAGLIILFLETGIIRNSGWYRKSFLIPVILVMLTFGVLTFSHSKDYKNRIVFWQNAVETSPSHALSFNNLGVMYFMDNNRVEAEKNFRKALEVNPKEKMSNFNIGIICAETGRPEEAEKFYLREIEINPTYSNTYFNLGVLYATNNHLEIAIKAWEKLLTINPYYTDCYYKLAEAYQSLNRPADVNRINALAKRNGITR